MGAARWRKPRSAKWRAQSLFASAARRRRAVPSGGTRSMWGHGSCGWGVAIRLTRCWEILATRSGSDGPDARAPRSPPPPRPASPEVTASCTCAVLPPEAVFHVSSTAPPRVPPSVAGALGTYSPRNGRRTRGAVPWRARAAAASSPWASILFSSEIAAAASTASPSQRRSPRCVVNHVPVRRRQG
ncbi:hypothetical protein PVAP13_9NG748754 [Panicum virgatum]|uniref:Uncharacterized protein n=1 Tax=Panicum virgatum TaxID=38727 RepID=A0A8T0N8T0_PANVG|nr:hypothetical protein PVAP13_9NG748754 [Panicum virgatum]